LSKLQILPSKAARSFDDFETLFDALLDASHGGGNEGGGGGTPLPETAFACVISTEPLVEKIKNDRLHIILCIYFTLRNSTKNCLVPLFKKIKGT